MIKVASLFCGAGGETLGQHEAFMDLGIPAHDIYHFALNHAHIAIAAHNLNFPWIDAHREAIEDVSADTFDIKHLTLLHMSPSCTHHSRARGGKPKNDQQRSHAWTVLENWIARCHIDIVTVENVAEWMEWGPLYTDHSDGCDGTATDENGEPVCLPGCHFGHPIPEYKGFYFVSFLLELRDIGYQVDYRILNSADYGDPTCRKRFYLIARRDGAPIRWPAPTHRDPKAKPGKYDPNLPTWRPAADIIDWSDLGKSIFERKRPLAPATQRRIAAGLVKYVLKGKPFIVKLSHGTDHGLGLQDVAEPLRTQTGQQDKAIVTPFLASLRGTAPDQIPNTAASAEAPLRTISAGGTHAALIAPFLAQVGYGERPGQAPRCQDVQVPLGTIVGAGKHAVVAPVLMTIDQQSTGDSAVRPVTDPMCTATTKARHALVAGFLEKGYGGPNGHQTPGAPLDGPLPAITTQDHSNLVAALLIHYYSSGGQSQSPADPLHVVTTVARHGLVTVDIDGETYVITDIRMRMLRPDELAKAMGFPSWYQWADPSGRPFSARDCCRLIGNACDVRTMKAINQAVVLARPEAFGLRPGAGPASSAVAGRLALEVA